MIPPYKPFSSEGWQVDPSQIIREIPTGIYDTLPSLGVHP
jgi:hypothetical protein